MTSTIFFLHITKTAGGSVKEMLRQSPAHVVFHYPTEPGFRKWFWYRPKPEIIFGHFIWGAHIAAQLPPRYAGFFREPISRSVSHYYQLCNVDPGPAGDHARSFDNLEDFLDGTRRWEFDNFMCRVVSGVANKKPFGSLDESVLDQALRNLRSFAFIGIFEDLASSLDRAAQIMPIAGDLPSVNRGTYDRRLSPTAKARLARMNALDMRLYDEAVRLAERQDTRKLMSHDRRPKLPDQNIGLPHGGSSLTGSQAPELRTLSVSHPAVAPAPAAR